MPVKCFTKKTKKGKGYTICVSPSKVSKRKGRVKGATDKKTRTRRTRKETAEARKMGAEDKPKKKGKMGGKRKGAGAKKKKKPKKKSATDEMVSAYENQARGLEPDIYSIIDQGLRDLDASASSIVIERPNQLGRQPSNSYWDDPIENDTPAYIQAVQGDMRDRALLEQAEGNIPTNAPGGQVAVSRAHLGYNLKGEKVGYEQYGGFVNRASYERAGYRNRKVGEEADNRPKKKLSTFERLMLERAQRRR
tara:strand:+ start:84 stop:833 length:750 start_codon:yes stop_codon:yes gene_type:complete